MIKKGFLSAFCALISGVCALSAASAAELRGLTLSAGADAAQLTLDLTEAAGHHLFTLDHPSRVVLDLPYTHRASGVRPPAASGVVKEVRLGIQPHGTLRVVVELRSPLPAHSTVGEAGRRLVLTLGAAPVLAGANAIPATPVPANAVPATTAPANQPFATPLPLDAPPVNAGSAPAVSAPRVVRAAHAPGEGERDVIIAVDAGHGGQDPGATGHGGTREKDVTLAIARVLAARIDAEPGMRAVLTRNRDEFLELRARIARAHAAHADLFISIHADSIADRSIAGASVYVLSEHGASSEAARWLAERENAADLVAGARPVDQGALEPVLIDAAQSEMVGISASAAERVVSALESVGEVRKAQVQRAGFVVLKSRDIPSMLIETAYISNPAEERRLRSPAQQARLADAIASGVRSYFLQNPPDGTRFKEERRTLASAGGSSTAGGVQ
jgi:N-acetylmuramoyl-L-alanine amidase